MNYLLVAATSAEIKPLLDHSNFHEGNNNLNGNQVNMLITGVGMVATAFSLGSHLATNKYDMAMNLGICGSFDRSFPLGELVNITEDTFAELGAEDGDDFIAIDGLGFGESKMVRIIHELPLHEVALRKARAITVNKVHGNETSILKIKERLNPQVESMEGAAFFYSCNQFNLPAVQVRAISNYVERRNRDNWNIGLAVKNLNSFAIDFLEQLNSMK